MVRKKKEIIKFDGHNVEIVRVKSPKGLPNAYLLYVIVDKDMTEDEIIQQALKEHQDSKGKIPEKIYGQKPFGQPTNWCIGIDCDVRVRTIESEP